MPAALAVKLQLWPLVLADRPAALGGSFRSGFSSCRLFALSSISSGLLQVVMLTVNQVIE